MFLAQHMLSILQITGVTFTAVAFDSGISVVCPLGSWCFTSLGADYMTLLRLDTVCDSVLQLQAFYVKSACSFWKAKTALEVVFIRSYNSTKLSRETKHYPLAPRSHQCNKHKRRKRQNAKQRNAVSGTSINIDIVFNISGYFALSKNLQEFYS